MKKTKFKYSKFVSNSESHDLFVVLLFFCSTVTVTTCMERETTRPPSHTPLLTPETTDRGLEMGMTKTGSNDALFGSDISR
jgi:hypothetical protein